MSDIMSLESLTSGPLYGTTESYIESDDIGYSLESVISAGLLTDPIDFDLRVSEHTLESVLMFSTEGFKDTIKKIWFKFVEWIKNIGRAIMNFIKKIINWISVKLGKPKPFLFSIVKDPAKLERFKERFTKFFNSVKDSKGFYVDDESGYVKYISFYGITAKEVIDNINKYIISDSYKKCVDKSIEIYEKNVVADINLGYDTYNEQTDTINDIFLYFPKVRGESYIHVLFEKNGNMTEADNGGWGESFFISLCDNKNKKDYTELLNAINKAISICQNSVDRFDKVIKKHNDPGLEGDHLVKSFMKHNKKLITEFQDVIMTLGNNIKFISIIDEFCLTASKEEKMFINGEDDFEEVSKKRDEKHKKIFNDILNDILKEE